MDADAQRLAQPAHRQQEGAGRDPGAASATTGNTSARVSSAGNRAVAHFLEHRRPSPGPAAAARVAGTGEPQELQAEEFADSEAPAVGLAAAAADDVPPSDGAAGFGNGRALDGGLRQRFENALGADLGDVRVHTGETAARAAERLHASAYSVGSDIVFGRDGFAPESLRGMHLLAHELAHVAQHTEAAATGGGQAVVHRAPEDVVALDKKLYAGVTAGDEAGFTAAAEALNYFADYDIVLRLSDHPGQGHPVLSRDQVAAIHRAAVRHKGMGPGSNAAKFTKYAQLDADADAAIAAGNWESAAETINGFSSDGMTSRLQRMSEDQLRRLQAGAVQNKRVGPGSAVYANVDKVLPGVRQAYLEKLATSTPGLTLPTVKGDGSGKPTFLSAGIINPGDTGVPKDKQESLGEAGTWRNDPKYIDNQITRVSYDILTGLFQVEYSDGTFLDTLSYDEVLKAGRSGGGPHSYFRSKSDGRVYPDGLDKGSIPTIAACAQVLKSKEKEAETRLLGTLINVAVSAAGVGNAVVSANRALAGPVGRGTPRKDSPKDKPATGGTSTGKSSPPPASTSGSTGGGGSSGGGSTTAKGQGGMQASAGRSGSGSGGGLQTVASGAKPSFVPVQGVPPAATFMKQLPKGAQFGQGFAATQAAGELLIEAEKYGPGLLVSVQKGATVTGGTVVAKGAVSVGGTSIPQAVVMSGGKFDAAGSIGGTAVLFALVTGDSVALVVKPATGSDEPAVAPGADSSSVTAPGKDSSTVTAPGKDSAAVKLPGTSQGSVSAPGANRLKETLLAASGDRSRAASILTRNNVPATKQAIDQYLDLLKAYNDALGRIDDSQLEGFEDSAFLDVNIGALRGSRSADFSAADALADALTKKPAGTTRKIRQEHKLTWHHHPEMGRMILMPTDEHGLAHWGGVSVWKMLTGGEYK